MTKYRIIRDQLYRRKLFAPRNISSSYNVIVLVRVVLKSFADGH